MARRISDSNLAYKLRRGQKDLINTIEFDDKETMKSTLQSTHRADFKTPPRPESPSRGKRRELMERYLFEKISADIANYEFRARSPPKYISTTHDHFDVPGFDPDASLQPKFEHSLYSDPAITFWSENKRQIPGVSVPDNPTGNFNYSARFSKPVSSRWDNDPEI
ncbi:uncharacterized protein NPIL_43121 [Nephila pilipes]|uniref:Uncharacterized protein n=1 Tax=Nephila pilipes TaxID=299642 RepID=A0A8X6N2T1_NEPPI|nr:uncharacterized protein NPIL_393541 [Nephila pilipes]GFU33915.1 uncharacterized protein NPIL_43121 [Nephila pilipes]